MQSQSHLIQRMVFELTAVGSKIDLEGEKKANRYQREIIEPAVEVCFRDIHGPARHLIIDYLDIDLGAFTPESFEKEAKKRLVERLSNELNEYGRDRSESAYSDPEYYPESGKDPEMPAASGTEEKMKKPSDTSELYYHAFSFFLERGRFPWWFITDQESADKKNIEEQFGPVWLRSLSNTEKSDLKQYLLKTGHVRTRLITTFDAEWVGEFLHQIGLAGKEAQTLRTIILPAFQNFPRLLPVFEQHFWTSWILAAGMEKRYPDMKHILEKTAKGDSRLLEEVSSEIRKIYLKDGIHPGFSDRVGLALSTLVQSKKEGLEKDQKNATVTEDYKPISSAEDQWKKTNISKESNLKSEIDVDESFSKEPLKEDMDTEEESLFIEAAGLVLLHPFLLELFEQTGLWDGESWLSDEPPFRSVRLLSYLTFGDSEVPEYRLLLHKILVGLELESVLPAEPALTPDELSACDELLRAVIHHWEALRNTTPDGLREGFLLREGKLMPSDEGYRLHIEKRTEDILLSKLPWGYSIIKFPWMNSLLNVSWI